MGQWFVFLTLTLLGLLMDVSYSAYSMNVTDCPGALGLLCMYKSITLVGYILNSLIESDIGLTAQLSLAGPSCNAFGEDIAELTIQVVYQSSTTFVSRTTYYSRWLTGDRIHVKIFDTAEQQFEIPESVIARPSAPATSYKRTSDLLFHHVSSPFAFWITRRSQPDAMPLFDTRISSLPVTPIAPLNPADPRTAFDAFPLVFEDQYLQVGLEYAIKLNQ